MLKISEIFDLSRTLAGEYLSEFVYPFEAVPKIHEIILKISENLGGGFKEISKGVYVHESAEISPAALICPPAVICANAEIRHCAYIRGDALIGEGCVVGNSTEIKNSVLFDGAKVPHFNYIGDSILGYMAHAGAGVILSNVKSDKTNVSINCNGERFYTGLKKLGSALGDYTEVGCNSVLNPGTVTGRGARIYPLSSVRGIVPAQSVFKNSQIFPIKK